MGETWTTPPITPDVEARFWARVIKTEDCWEWQSASGYGLLQIGGKPYRVHRVAWAIANGPIPDGLDILHRCHNKRCVRPDHLHAGTPGDNAADDVSRYPDPRAGWICLSEAARQLGLSRNTLRQQLMRRKLTGRKFMEWYISEREVERYRATSLGARRPK